ncbi:ubiquitin-2 like Rad60 SUMO-like-domain-containing protein [Phaeosphaeriaceae sp. PMI808]|nr:ubiquitin-2 like Rad60 SUMO-like-domain-containing protein [Phaeosphaeriaceae sp. PMI808]
MTDASQGAPAPKKRSFFKRAAWQDAPTKDSENMFSHANEFGNIVAEQNKREEEKRAKAEEERKRKQADHEERKRRKVSIDHETPKPTRSSGSRSPEAPPDSLSSRYNVLAKSASTHESLPKQSVVIDLGDSDDEDNNNVAYNPASLNGNSSFEYRTSRNDRVHPIALRTSGRVPSDDGDDDVQEMLDPALAALAARARERAAKRAHTAAAPTTGEPEKAPIAQLFISPEIPAANPLMVKVRIDSTLEKTRLAWCGRQGYSSEMTKNVFFTWKGTRVYDSTTIKRLGIHVDPSGAVSIEGDPNIYDDENLPKVYVEAWTDALFQEHKKQEAAEAAAKKKSAESPPVEERQPTPEPVPTANRIRLILKAKGKEDFRLVVNPETSFGHIAEAYKQRRDIDPSQPVTLMFDGDRLPPLITIADSEIEDMDSIDILFK